MLKIALIMFTKIQKQIWIWFMREIYPSARLSPSVLYFRRVGVYFCVIWFLSLCQTCLFDFPEKLQEKGQREANVQRLQRELQLHQAQTSLQVLRSGEHRLDLFIGNEGTHPLWGGEFIFSHLSGNNSVLLQAICAKCSKTLDNKTSRVCPECFEASLSLENLGVNEQKRKAAPEVSQTNAKQTKVHYKLT